MNSSIIKEMTFQLHEQEYIELNRLLKFLGLVDSGGDAMVRIDQGEVKVNGETEFRRRRKLRSGDVVNFNNEKIELI